MEADVTCKPEIYRSFPSYDAAFDYLVSRGFFPLPRGWVNGRWRAAITDRGHCVMVSVRLKAA